MPHLAISIYPRPVYFHRVKLFCLIIAEAMFTTFLAFWTCLASYISETGASPVSSQRQISVGEMRLIENTISDNPVALKSEKVPGDNDAYFCGPPREEQTAYIEELTVSPWPVLSYVYPRSFR